MTAGAYGIIDRKPYQKTIDARPFPDLPWHCSQDWAHRAPLIIAQVFKVPECPGRNKPDISLLHRSGALRRPPFHRWELSSRRRQEAASETSSSISSLGIPIDRSMLGDRLSPLSPCYSTPESPERAYPAATLASAISMHLIDPYVLAWLSFEAILAGRSGLQLRFSWRCSTFTDVSIILLGRRIKHFVSGLVFP